MSSECAVKPTVKDVGIYACILLCSIQHRQQFHFHFLETSWLLSFSNELKRQFDCFRSIGRGVQCLTIFRCFLTISRFLKKTLQVYWLAINDTLSLFHHSWIADQGTGSFAWQIVGKNLPMIKCRPFQQITSHLAWLDSLFRAFHKISTSIRHLHWT